jgi:hypothetical protein
MHRDKSHSILRTAAIAGQQTGMTELATLYRQSLELALINRRCNGKQVHNLEGEEGAGQKSCTPA